MLMGHFLLKVALCFLLGWSLLGGERGVASDSFLNLSYPVSVVATPSVNTPEEIQEVLILPQSMISFFKGAGMEGQAIGKPDGPVLADVYFDESRQFIDDGLKGLFLQTVERLNQEPDWRLQIEGHCDSRGTSAYNLARADFHLANLTRYLLMLGGRSHQISSINYGQDPIACRASSESCQEDNLRAQHIFSNLAIRHTQRGCLTRLRFVPGQDWHRALRYSRHLQNLQRIQVASSFSSF
jgi:hypothetical protein